MQKFEFFVSHCASVDGSFQKRNERTEIVLKRSFEDFCFSVYMNRFKFLYIMPFAFEG